MIDDERDRISALIDEIDSKIDDFKQQIEELE